MQARPTTTRLRSGEPQVLSVFSERKPGNSVSLPGTQAEATLGRLLRLGTAHRIGDPLVDGPHNPRRAITSSIPKD
jgi:hypothetical protein